MASSTTPRLTSAPETGAPSAFRARIVYDAVSRGLYSFLLEMISRFSILSRAGNNQALVHRVHVAALDVRHAEEHIGREVGLDGNVEDDRTARRVDTLHGHHCIQFRTDQEMGVVSRQDRQDVSGLADSV